MYVQDVSGGGGSYDHIYFRQLFCFVQLSFSLNVVAELAARLLIQEIPCSCL
jgi:hypothetical protein